ncbi:hypothetical protein [Terrimicrobium sacchariphilum]|nr:hypothetical protein [Terrimicrobium sacchariphilum]
MWSFLTVQMLFLLAPVGFMLICAMAAPMKAGTRWDVFFAGLVGVVAGWVAFSVLWAAGLIGRDAGGLDRGLAMIGLLGCSYVSAGMYFFFARIWRTTHHGAVREGARWDAARDGRSDKT